MTALPPRVIAARRAKAERPRAHGTSAPAGRSARDPLAPLSREVKFAGAPLSMVEADGVFEGYASLFGVVDLGKDMVEPGAFAESIGRRGAKGVKMLWSHDPAEPIGVWDIIREDLLGLKVRGRLNLQVSRAREVRALMQSGAIDGLSIGFKTVAARRDPRTGIRKLSRIDLFEVSLVTFPMLPEARVTAVKRAFRPLDGPPARAVRAITQATRTMQPKETIRP
jgi:uncharacterized protein